MIGISSSSAGVIFIPGKGTPDAREYSIHDLVEGVVMEQAEAHLRYSVVQDWEEIEGRDAATLLESATREYWLTRTVSHLRLAIRGLEKSLEMRVLEDITENLGARFSPDDVLNRLLVAPLANPQSPHALAKSALAQGFAAVASILDDLMDLQPLLHRMTDRWLDLPEAVLSVASESREMIWATVSKRGGLKELIKASNKRDFELKWALQVYNFMSPQTRSSFPAIGAELAERLFPDEAPERTRAQTVDTDPSYVEVEKQEGADHETYERVKKQINAIAKEVSEGSDTLAGKWLRQLVEEQTSVAGGEEFAVKSLCNIAQICADMFRNDFEIICLEMALELKPFDEWALIQHGDHLKRGGNYEEALKVLDQARRYGESVVAISSIADVYSEQGDYEKAISVYKTIPAWSETPAVLTGIADNLRKMGRMDESISTYEQLNQRARQGLPGYEFSESRAQAGLAEVAKRQGRFEDALRIYEGILQHESPDIQDKPFYRLGLCNVLTLMGYFKRAYSVVDNVIVDYPFAREARFMRAAILGLIGRETRGLEDVPEGKGTGSGREWLGSYYRGLLLFRLKRYEDAKRILVRELPNTVAAGETRAKLRLGATLCHLREGSILEADAILSDIPDLYNCHLQYLSLVLRLHSAAQKEDRDIIARLRKQIDDLDIVDSTLGEAVMAIDRGDLSLAISYATDALIKLAA